MKTQRNRLENNEYFKTINKKKKNTAPCKNVRSMNIQVLPKHTLTQRNKVISYYRIQVWTTRVYNVYGIYIYIC